MSRYPEVPLGELLHQASDEVTVSADATYETVGILSFGRGLFPRPTVSGLRTSYSSFYRLRSGQFVYSRLFAWEGALAVVDPKWEGLLVSSEFPVFDIDERVASPAWLYWACRWPTLWERLRGGTKGLGLRRQRVHPEHLLDVSIPLPPREMQDELASQLEARAARAASLTQASREAAPEASALSRSHVRERFEALRREFPTRSLAELVSFGGGGTPSRSDLRYWSGPIPWVSPKDMKRPLIEDSIEHVSQTALDETTIRLHPPGTVLVVIRGMILVRRVPVAIAGPAVTVNQDMKALLPGPEIRSDYLAHALGSVEDALLAHAELSTHGTRRLATELLAAVEVPVPPLDEQARIAEQLDAYSARARRIGLLQDEMTVLGKALEVRLIHDTLTGAAIA
jgi:type I restriction enzyme, S subunit